MRECGECTLCCLVPAVPEIAKPINTMCKFCTTNCTIYEDRPDSCRAFDCAWLLGAMDEDMRPDKSHVVIEMLPEASVVLALVEPGYESVLPSLNDRLSEFTERGVSIVASDGRARFGNGADRESVQKALTKTAQQFGMF